MPASSAVQEFIESLAPEALCIDRLWDLAKAAKRLAAAEPQLAAQFTLIRWGFGALAREWEGEALDASVPETVTPPILAAIKSALNRPGLGSSNELARILAWACNYPLDGQSRGTTN